MPEPYTSGEIAELAINRRAGSGPLKFDPLRVVATYANPENWKQIHDEEGCHWTWDGPVIVGWELAHWLFAHGPDFMPVPAQNIEEMTARLESVGFGKEGTPNTLWAMVMAACDEIERLRDVDVIEVEEGKEFDCPCTYDRESTQYLPEGCKHPKNELRQEDGKWLDGCGTRESDLQPPMHCPLRQRPTLLQFKDAKQE